MSATRAPGSTWLALGLLAGATLLAYANSFHGPFVFDDVPSIVENGTIRRLGSLDVLSPPAEGGQTVSGRPVLNLSLALNHAVSGLEVWSYHALNVLIHLLAGFVFFALARRTLERPPLARSAADAWSVALVIAGLWLLHPLQVESVTYLIQRAESLMGLLFLLSLYAFVRAADSRRPRGWIALSFVSALLCAGTKEVAVLLPVIAFLYDRTFVSGSFRTAWERHRGRHLLLATIWLPLAWLVVSAGGNRGNTMGFDVGISAAGYWLVQFEAVTRYLWLTFWPHPLVFDYGQVAAPRLVAALPWALPVVAVVAATAWALWRRPVAGFLGAWFLGILAPTSVVPGALQMIVEHRMYLPLAAVIALVAGSAAPRLGRRGVLLAGGVLALAAGTVTWHRNADYRDEETLWKDTIAKRPENARTHNNLGRHYYLQGRWAEALASFDESLRLDPSSAKTHFNRGLALLRLDRPAEAVAPLQAAVRILPHYFSAHLNLGIALTLTDRAVEALPHFAAARTFDPWPAEVHFQWGVALARLGRWPEAITHYAECLRLDPRQAEALANWGSALMAMNSIPEAIGRFEAALDIRRDLPGLHFNLGVAQSALGRSREAVAYYTEAVRLAPSHAQAHLNLGIGLAQAGQLDAAIGHLETAARLSPGDPATHANLGVALALAGRPEAALACYQAALRLHPDDAQANYNVGFALLEAGRTAEARPYFETAVRLRPNFPAAQDILDRLRTMEPR
jgi:tetratricopeptide (TPR) repeat protein